MPPQGENTDAVLFEQIKGKCLSLLLDLLLGNSSIIGKDFCLNQQKKSSHQDYYFAINRNTC